MSNHVMCMLLAASGNAAVEVAKLLDYAQRGRYHSKYRDWRFWLVRLLMMGFAGIMGLAYSLSGFSIPIFSFHVGAAATLLLGQWSNAAPPTPEQGSAPAA